MVRGNIVWKLGEVVQTLKFRQNNKFDCNLVVTGKRGLGKSTFLVKMFYRFDGYRPWKHQVYRRQDVKKLLINSRFGLCFDDEAINTAYKREFFDREQQAHIKHVTAYRDNFNVYASAVPSFYSLDKDLRELIFMHVHIIERGLAVIFLQLEDSIHSLDPWDTKNNSRLEEKWQQKKRDDVSFKFPYHKMSTFAGYIYFKDITKKQRIIYEDVKKRKREMAFNDEKEEEELNFNEKLYKMLIDKKLTQEGLRQACLLEGKKFSTVSGKLNKTLKDNGIKETVTSYFRSHTQKERDSGMRLKVEDIIPNL